MKQNRVWTKQEEKELNWWGITFLRQCEAIVALDQVPPKELVQ